MIAHIPQPSTLVPKSCLANTLEQRDSPYERVPSTELSYDRDNGIVNLARSEEHTSELQHLVCRLLLEKKKDLI